ncbi:MAG: CRISPR-associated endonuclease Cas2 [Fimbriimonadales bacterium]|jgi:CRISPR-associated protein Cas2|nr:CRISPR-associated endonuclease Cas2 [Fimbriimonadales bacterium]
MRGVADYAVAYDISADDERERVEKVLKDFGFRIQKSVFECRLTPTRLRLLIARLRAVNPQTGFVKVYRIDRQFRPRVIGVAPPHPDEGAAFII